MSYPTSADVAARSLATPLSVHYQAKQRSFTMPEANSGGEVPRAFQVVEIEDADTITIINESGDREEIRFAYVDAPEYGEGKYEQSGGKEARESVFQRIQDAGMQVYLDRHGKGVFGRTIAEVYLSPTADKTSNLNYQLLREGRVIPSGYWGDLTAKQRQKWLDAAEEGVRRAKKLPGEQYAEMEGTISPAEWRRIRKQYEGPDFEGSFSPKSDTLRARLEMFFSGDKGEMKRYRELAQAGMLGMEHGKFVEKSKYDEGPLGEFYRVSVSERRGKEWRRDVDVAYMPTMMQDDYFALFGKKTALPEFRMYEDTWEAFTGKEATGWRRDALQRMDRMVGDPGLGYKLNQMIGTQLYSKGDGLSVMMAKGVGRVLDTLTGHYAYVNAKAEQEGEFKGTMNAYHQTQYTQAPPRGPFEQLMGGVTGSMRDLSLTLASYFTVSHTWSVAMSHMEDKGIDWLTHKALMGKGVSQTFFRSGYFSGAVGDTMRIANAMHADVARVVGNTMTTGHAVDAAMTRVRNVAMVEAAMDKVGQDAALNLGGFKSLAEFNTAKDFVRSHGSDRFIKNVQKRITDHWDEAAQGLDSVSARLASSYDDTIDDARKAANKAMRSMGFDLDAGKMKWNADGFGLSFAGTAASSRRIGATMFEGLGIPILRMIAAVDPRDRTEVMAFETAVDRLRNVIGMDAELSFRNESNELVDLAVRSTDKAPTAGFKRMEAMAEAWEEVARFIPANMSIWPKPIRDMFGITSIKGELPKHLQTYAKDGTLINKYHPDSTSLKSLIGTGFKGLTAISHRTVGRITDLAKNPLGSIMKNLEAFHNESQLRKMERAMQKEFKQEFTRLGRRSSFATRSAWRRQHTHSAQKVFQDLTRHLTHADTADFQRRLVNRLTGTTGSKYGNYMQLVERQNQLLHTVDAVQEDLVTRTNAPFRAFRKGLMVMGGFFVVDHFLEKYVMRQQGADIISQFMADRAMVDEDGDRIRSMQFEARMPKLVKMGAAAVGAAIGGTVFGHTYSVTTPIGAIQEAQDRIINQMVDHRDLSKGAVYGEIPDALGAWSDRLESQYAHGKKALRIMEARAKKGVLEVTKADALDAAIIKQKHKVAKLAAARSASGGIKRTRFGRRFGVTGAIAGMAVSMMAAQGVTTSLTYFMNTVMGRTRKRASLDKVTDVEAARYIKAYRSAYDARSKGTGYTTAKEAGDMVTLHLLTQNLQASGKPAREGMYSIAQQHTNPLFQVTMVQRLDPRGNIMSVSGGFQFLPMLGMGLTPALPVGVAMRPTKRPPKLSQKEKEELRKARLAGDIHTANKIEEQAAARGGGLLGTIGSWLSADAFVWNEKSNMSQAMMFIGAAAMMEKGTRTVGNFMRKSRFLTREMQNLQMAGSAIKVGTRLMRNAVEFSMAPMFAAPTVIGDALHAVTGIKSTAPAKVLGGNRGRILSTLGIGYILARSASKVDTYDPRTGEYIENQPMEAWHRRANDALIAAYYTAAFEKAGVLKPLSHFSYEDFKARKMAKGAARKEVSRSWVRRLRKGMFAEENMQLALMAHRRSAAYKAMEEANTQVGKGAVGGLADPVTGRIDPSTVVTTPGASYADEAAETVAETAEAVARTMDDDAARLAARNAPRHFDTLFPRMRMAAKILFMTKLAVTGTMLGITAIAPRTTEAIYKVAPFLRQISGVEPPQDERQRIFDPIRAHTSARYRPKNLHEAALSMADFVWGLTPFAKFGDLKEMTGAYKDDPNMFLNLAGPVGFTQTDKGIRQYMQLQGDATDISTTAYGNFLKGISGDLALVSRQVLGATPVRVDDPAVLLQIRRGSTARRKQMHLRNFREKASTSAVHNLALAVREDKNRWLSWQRPDELFMDELVEAARLGMIGDRNIRNRRVQGPMDWMGDMVFSRPERTRGRNMFSELFRGKQGPENFSDWIVNNIQQDFSRGRDITGAGATMNALSGIYKHTWMGFDAEALGASFLKLAAGASVMIPLLAGALPMITGAVAAGAAITVGQHRTTTLRNIEDSMTAIRTRRMGPIAKLTKNNLPDARYVWHGRNYFESAMQNKASAGIRMMGSGGAWAYEVGLTGRLTAGQANQLSKTMSAKYNRFVDTSVSLIENADTLWNKLDPSFYSGTKLDDGVTIIKDTIVEKLTDSKGGLGQKTTIRYFKGGGKTQVLTLGDAIGFGKMHEKGFAEFIAQQFNVEDLKAEIADLATTYAGRADEFKLAVKEFIAKKIEKVFLDHEAMITKMSPTTVAKQAGMTTRQKIKQVTNQSLKARDYLKHMPSELRHVDDIVETTFAKSIRDHGITGTFTKAAMGAGTALQYGLVAQELFGFFDTLGATGHKDSMIRRQAAALLPRMGAEIGMSYAISAVMSGGMASIASTLAIGAGVLAAGWMLNKASGGRLWQGLKRTSASMEKGAGWASLKFLEAVHNTPVLGQAWSMATAPIRGISSLISPALTKWRQDALQNNSPLLMAMPETFESALLRPQFMKPTRRWYGERMELFSHAEILQQQKALVTERRMRALQTNASMDFGLVHKEYLGGLNAVGALDQLEAQRYFSGGDRVLAGASRQAFGMTNTMRQALLVRQEITNQQVHSAWVRRGQDKTSEHIWRYAGMATAMMKANRAKGGSVFGINMLLGEVQSLTRTPSAKAIGSSLGYIGERFHNFYDGLWYASGRASKTALAPLAKWAGDTATSIATSAAQGAKFMGVDLGFIGSGAYRLADFTKDVHAQLTGGKEMSKWLKEMPTNFVKTTAGSAIGLGVGTSIGSGLGGLIGGVVGGDEGSRELGQQIGGGIGGVSGALIGGALAHRAPRAWFRKNLVQRGIEWWMGSKMSDAKLTKGYNPLRRAMSDTLDFGYGFFRGLMDRLNFLDPQAGPTTHRRSAGAARRLHWYRLKRARRSVAKSVSEKLSNLRASVGGWQAVKTVRRVTDPLLDTVRTGVGGLVDTALWAGKAVKKAVGTAFDSLRTGTRFAGMRGAGTVMTEMAPAILDVAFLYGASQQVRELKGTDRYMEYDRAYKGLSSMAIESIASSAAFSLVRGKGAGLTIIGLTRAADEFIAKPIGQWLAQSAYDEMKERVDVAGEKAGISKYRRLATDKHYWTQADTIGHTLAYTAVGASIYSSSITAASSFYRSTPSSVQGLHATARTLAGKWARFNMKAAARFRYAGSKKLIQPGIRVASRYVPGVAGATAGVGKFAKAAGARWNAVSPALGGLLLAADTAVTTYKTDRMLGVAAQRGGWRSTIAAIDKAHEKSIMQAHTTTAMAIGTLGGPIGTIAGLAVGSITGMIHSHYDRKARHKFMRENYMDNARGARHYAKGAQIGGRWGTGIGIAAGVGLVALATVTAPIWMPILGIASVGTAAAVGIGAATIAATTAIGRAIGMHQGGRKSVESFKERDKSVKTTRKRIYSYSTLERQGLVTDDAYKKIYSDKVKRRRVKHTQDGEPVPPHHDKVADPKENKSTGIKCKDTALKTPAAPTKTLESCPPKTEKVTTEAPAASAAAGKVSTTAEAAPKAVEKIKSSKEIVEEQAPATYEDKKAKGQVLSGAIMLGTGVLIGIGTVAAAPAIAAAGVTAAGVAAVGAAVGLVGMGATFLYKGIKTQRDRRRERKIEQSTKQAANVTVGTTPEEQRAAASLRQQQKRGGPNALGRIGRGVTEFFLGAPAAAADIPADARLPQFNSNPVKTQAQMQEQEKQATAATTVRKARAASTSSTIIDSAEDAIDSKRAKDAFIHKENVPWWKQGLETLLSAWRALTETGKEILNWAENQWNRLRRLAANMRDALTGASDTAAGEMGPHPFVVENEQWAEGQLTKMYEAIGLADKYPQQTSGAGDQIAGLTPQQQAVYDVFSAAGYSDQAIAGIMGNIDVESGNWDVDRLEGNNGPGVGLFQYTHWSRKDRLYAAGWKKGMDPYESAKLQAQVMLSEINGADALAKNFKPYTQTTDTVEAAKMFMEYAENPGVPHWERRRKAALQWEERLRTAQRTSAATSVNPDSSANANMKVDIKALMSVYRETVIGIGNRADLYTGSRDSGSASYGTFDPSRYDVPLEATPRGIEEVRTFSDWDIHHPRSRAGQGEQWKTRTYGGVTQSLLNKDIILRTKDGKQEGVGIPIVGNGTVVAARSMQGYGNAVVIKLDSGGLVIYAHGSRPSPFKAGDKVKSGDIVLHQGKTGIGTGVHLHMESSEEYARKFLDFVNGRLAPSNSQTAAANSPNEDSSSPMSTDNAATKLKDDTKSFAEFFKPGAYITSYMTDRLVSEFKQGRGLSEAEEKILRQEINTYNAGLPRGAKEIAEENDAVARRIPTLHEQREKVKRNYPGSYGSPGQPRNLSAGDKVDNTLGKEFAYMYDTGKRDQEGFRLMRFVVVGADGTVKQAVTARSGTKVKQDQLSNSQTNISGQGHATPEGVHVIRHQQDSSSHPGIRGTFVNFQPTFASNRSALGVHWDADRGQYREAHKKKGYGSSTGTIGCIGIENEADMKAIAPLLKPGMQIFVDYGSESLQGSNQAIMSQIKSLRQQRKELETTSGAGDVRTQRRRNDPAWNVRQQDVRKAKSNKIYISAGHRNTLRGGAPGEYEITPMMAKRFQQIGKQYGFEVILIDHKNDSRSLSSIGDELAKYNRQGHYAVELHFDVKDSGHSGVIPPVPGKPIHEYDMALAKSFGRFHHKWGTGEVTGRPLGLSRRGVTILELDPMDAELVRLAKSNPNGPEMAGIADQYAHQFFGAISGKEQPSSTSSTNTSRAASNPYDQHMTEARAAMQRYRDGGNAGEYQNALINVRRALKVKPNDAKAKKMEKQLQADIERIKSGQSPTGQLQSSLSGAPTQTDRDPHAQMEQEQQLAAKPPELSPEQRREVEAASPRGGEMTTQELQQVTDGVRSANHLVAEILATAKPDMVIGVTLGGQTIAFHDSNVGVQDPTSDMIVNNGFFAEREVVATNKNGDIQFSVLTELDTPSFSTTVMANTTMPVDSEMAAADPSMAPCQTHCEATALA